MPDSEAQAIGSSLELPKGGESGERGKKQERMAVRYSGQRVLSSNEAKQRVLTALLRHPLAQSGVSNQLAPASFCWHHIRQQPESTEKPRPASSSSSDPASSSSCEDDRHWADVACLAETAWFLQGQRVHLVRRRLPLCRGVVKHLLLRVRT